MSTAVVTIVVAVIAAVGSMTVGLFGWNTAKANRIDARLDKLWARVDKLDKDLAEEKAYNLLLVNHINEGLPPPPPPRPTTE